ncbi:MAG: CpaF family protein [Bdellovibrionaceae bacterium]|nr:CpaF family protein [Pseudobdellovibrionaceae bacterium]
MSKVSASIHPIQFLMSDPLVSEIMVNGYNKIFVEREGFLEPTTACFTNEAQLDSYVDSILKANGQSRDSGFYFDGVLPNGYRFNIILPPMNPKGPCVTIRKFSDKLFTLRTLVEKKSLTDRAEMFLKAMVIAKMNIVVSGGTGSGKTTFLQALSGEIPARERVVTIEDIPELKLHQSNWIQLISVRAGERPVSIRDCLINSLRMRPDRVIVGECRRDEAFEMLQAMNTGHEGSMTTVHANSPNDCLTRLENLLHMSGFDVSTKILRRQIADTLNFVIQLKRSIDGRRIVSEILEITGLEGEIITRSPVFSLDSNGVLSPTGYVPKDVASFKERGIVFPSRFFDPQFAPKKTS